MQTRDVKNKFYLEYFCEYLQWPVYLITVKHSERRKVERRPTQVRTAQAGMFLSNLEIDIIVNDLMVCPFTEHL